MESKSVTKSDGLSSKVGQTRQGDSNMNSQADNVQLRVKGRRDVHGSQKEETKNRIRGSRGIQQNKVPTACRQKTPTSPSARSTPYPTLSQTGTRNASQSAASQSLCRKRAQFDGKHLRKSHSATSFDDKQSLGRKHSVKQLSSSGSSSKLAVDGQHKGRGHAQRATSPSEARSSVHKSIDAKPKRVISLGPEDRGALDDEHTQTVCSSDNISTNVMLKSIEVDCESRTHIESDPVPPRTGASDTCNMGATRTYSPSSMDKPVPSIFQASQNLLEEIAEKRRLLRGRSCPKAEEASCPKTDMGKDMVESIAHDEQTRETKPVSPPKIASPQLHSREDDDDDDDDDDTAQSGGRSLENIDNAPTPTFRLPAQPDMCARRDKAHSILDESGTSALSPTSGTPCLADSALTKSQILLDGLKELGLDEEVGVLTEVLATERSLASTQLSSRPPLSAKLDDCLNTRNEDKTTLEHQCPSTMLNNVMSHSSKGVMEDVGAIAANVEQALQSKSNPIELVKMVTDMLKQLQDLKARLDDRDEKSTAASSFSTATFTSTPTVSPQICSRVIQENVCNPVLSQGNPLQQRIAPTLITPHRHSLECCPNVGMAPLPLSSMGNVSGMLQANGSLARQFSPYITTTTTTTSVYRIL